MNDFTRYQRQMLLPGFGYEAQEKLMGAKVIVIGAGGLGCPVLLALAAAGIGALAVVDFDIVDVSNLHRQLLFSIEDVGKPKARVAADKLSRQFPGVRMVAQVTTVTPQNVVTLISEYDVVMDCTDSFPARYMINDACLLLNKVLVYGGIFQYEGQAAVFNYKLEEGRSCNYRDVFPHPPKADEIPTCNEAGVLGTLTGVIGNIQANEAIKILTGIGQPLVNRLVIYNSRTCRMYQLGIQKSEEAVKLVPKTVSALETTAYDMDCQSGEMKEIDAEQFNAFIHNPSWDFIIVDVREKSEQPVLNIAGVMQLPFSNFSETEKGIPACENLVLICQSGVRSRKAAQLITHTDRFANVYSLKGGVIELFRNTRV